MKRIESLSDAAGSEMVDGLLSFYIWRRNRAPPGLVKYVHLFEGSCGQLIGRIC